MFDMAPRYATLHLGPAELWPNMGLKGALIVGDIGTGMAYASSIFNFLERRQPYQHNILMFSDSWYTHPEHLAWACIQLVLRLWVAIADQGLDATLTRLVDGTSLQGLSIRYYRHRAPA